MVKVAVDITASGFSPEVYGELISISACEMLAPGEVGAFFHSYINPLRELSPLWVRLLEIDSETLNSAPPLTPVAEQFFDFLTDRQVVCVGLEMTSVYLNDALAQLGRPALPSSAFLSVWNMVPNDIIETGLDAIEKYTEVPPEKNYSAPRSSLRVAQMYWNVCAKQGLSG